MLTFKVGLFHCVELISFMQAQVVKIKIFQSSNGGLSPWRLFSFQVDSLAVMKRPDADVFLTIAATEHRLWKWQWDRASWRTCHFQHNTFLRFVISKLPARALGTIIIHCVYIRRNVLYSRASSHRNFSPVVFLNFWHMS